MQTHVLPVDAERPELKVISKAAGILRRGGLVAFPTETVYGLGANALDEAAVQRIFAAKGRPATNPVIVHVADIASARDLVAEWPEQAERLAERFWPGPLTLVLPKIDLVPNMVTAGASTVALRVPAHPVALALLQAAQFPIAAPSANCSTALSPTRAEHVLYGLDGLIDLVLDAGPVPGGLESTVIDLTVKPPRILRPGLVTPAELEAAIGTVLRPRAHAWADSSEPKKSPGMLERHYAPRTPLEGVAGNSVERVRELSTQGLRVGWIAFSDVAKQGATATVVRILPADPGACAKELYAVLHELDAAGLDRIVVALPPATEEWLAVRDRLRRAATCFADGNGFED
ncbi:MAG: threonylcarbamoyl-AMP synthase [Gemmataceae bacterium]|nr:threonylcarbamoyl-AMP synthase [Gemmataceae bacterium]